MWKEFKAFAFKGNVMDMAVGVMIAGAFGKIVTSLVNDLFMPLIGLLVGGVNFENLFWVMNGDGTQFATAADAQAAGFATLAYGNFISVVIDFLLIAVCIFFLLKVLNKLKRPAKEEPAAEPAKEPRLCPFCRTEIADDATRCPHCTSRLDEVE